MRDAYVMSLKSGTTFDLKYSFKAVRHFEKITGQHFFGDSAAGHIGTEYLVAGIVAGLIWERPSIKGEEIEAAIEKHLDSGGDLPALVQQLMEALQKGGVLRNPNAPEAGGEPRPTTPPESVAT